MSQMDLYPSANIALLVIDVQNGFVSDGGSYDLLGMNVSNYQKVVPKIKELIDLCRKFKIPIFYTQAVREASGIDLLTKTHRILPVSREERIKKRPICVRGTWDSKILEEISFSDIFFNTVELLPKIKNMFDKSQYYIKILLYSDNKKENSDIKNRIKIMFKALESIYIQYFLKAKAKNVN